MSASSRLIAAGPLEEPRAFTNLQPIFQTLLTSSGELGAPPAYILVREPEIKVLQVLKANNLWILRYRGKADFLLSMTLQISSASVLSVSDILAVEESTANTVMDSLGMAYRAAVSITSLHVTSHALV